MVKRWLSTFAEQPSPAALQVVAEDLGERMRCSDDIGHQRGGVLRIGDCSSRTGADGDRMQRASISSARAGLSINMDCMRQHCSAAPSTSSCRCNKTKEHSSLQRNELFTRGGKCRAAELLRCTAMEVPRRGVSECANAVFLRARAPAPANPVRREDRYSGERPTGAP